MEREGAKPEMHEMEKDRSYSRNSAGFCRWIHRHRKIFKISGSVSPFL
jgi:hypothetical protein